MRAVRAGQSRSRIEGDQVREWFSPNYSFAYQRRRSTRTSLVGRVIRSTGLLGRNGPGRGLRERFSTLESFVYRERGDTRTTFVQFFVRVLGEARYANDLSTRGPGRAGDEARAGGHHRSRCSSPSFEKPGFCTIPDPRAENAGFPGPDVSIRPLENIPILCEIYRIVLLRHCTPGDFCCTINLDE